MQTPSLFLTEAAPYITNIHMKDYRVLKTEKGICLRRVKLGEGFINLSEMKNKITQLPSLKNISMELAAHPDRYCDIDDVRYPRCFKYQTAMQQAKYREYIKTLLLPDQMDYTPNGLSDLTRKEIEETLSSCAVLKEMFP